jgi:hypothetical protein
MSSTVFAKGDSGASKHYFKENDKHVLNNPSTDNHGPTVLLPNDDSMTSTSSGLLPFQSSLSKSACKTHIFKDLQSSSLISLGQLCDDNCTVTLTKNLLRVTKNNQVIMRGIRNPSDGLWDIPITTRSISNSSNHSSSFQHRANVIITKDKTKTELVKYLHACCFSPATSTFIKAVQNGNFITWPGLEASTIRKFLPDSIATAKGHLDQEQKNLQSTKPTTTPSDEFNDFFPTPSTPNEVTNECCALLFPFVPKHVGYTDLTGRFPHISARGNKYLLIVYDFDSNAILVEPLKSRQAGEIKRAWQSLHDILIKRGTAPKMYILDNEASNELKNAMIKNKLSYQLAPPHIHRRNAAERAIRTFKNHLLAGLASADPNYPVAHWDRLLHQAVLTLNILRNSRVNPKLSAYAYLYGNFDFNRTPLAPPGTKVVVHLKANNRASWEYHGEEGWYVGPSMEHYRCVKCFLPATNRVRDADTVKFFPHQIPFPSTTTTDYLHQAANDILALLKDPPKSSLPSLESGCATNNALTKIATLLQRATKMPAPIQPEPQSPSSISPTAPVPRVEQTKLPSPQSSPATPITPTPTSRDSIPLAPPTPTHASAPRVEKLPVNNNKAQNFQKISLPSLLRKEQQRRALLQSNAFQKALRQHNLRQQYLQHHNYRHRASQYLAAQHIFQPTIHHIYNEQTGKKETIDSLLQGKNKKIWQKAVSNEFGRLAQGNVHGILATDTIDFIHKAEVPTARDITYASFVCDYRPLKSEPYRCRIVVGGDKLSYDHDPASPAASLLETKLILNSTISDAKNGARFMSCDLKDHFLASPMERPEYMKIPIRNIPDDIIEMYKLNEKVAKDGYVYIKIKKGMYGLKQAALLAFDHLVNCLEPFGYVPCKHSVGLWRHKTRKTRFCLCVDDFGVKYFCKEDADHLIETLRKFFKVSVDWEGRNYCGLTIDWNYNAGHVDISMPGYVSKALLKFQHTPPQHKVYAPHNWTRPAYGQKTQFAPPEDETPLLDAKEKTRIQAIVGSFLYYARAVDPTMLPALNEIGTQQASPTEATRNKANMLLDYACTYPNAKIRYYASDMVLHVDSDAAYLVLPNAKSRIAGHYFLSSTPPKHPLKPSPQPNGPILTECRTLRNVVASAAEAETGGLFHNAQTTLPIRVALEELDHPQPPTPLKTDNSTATSFVHSSMKQKRSKSWDMRYHWLRERQLKEQLRIYWDKGINNDADYFTKHHPPKHHQMMRSKYILKANLIRFVRHALSSRRVRGCVSPQSHMDRLESRFTRTNPVVTHELSHFDRHS